MKFYLISLGCAKNLVDSEKISAGLSKYGYRITDRIEDAELILINTCGFIRAAKQESVDVILSALQEKPSEAKLAVLGCLVQRYKKELEEAIPEADFFLPVLPYDELINRVRNKFPVKREPCHEVSSKVLFTPPSYTYIKIAEGCNNRCAYCTIPVIRGPLSSRKIQDIVKEAKGALDNNVHEINLIAQDLTSYGKDIYDAPSLDKLLKALLSIRKDFWLRLLYLYPSGISSGLIKLIKSDSRIVRYVDIPAQHVNDRILKLMNRRYSKKLLTETIFRLREIIPDIAIRSTFIVGFPSESEEDFEEMADFVKQMEFDRLGVFEYSSEEDTKAFALKPRVPSVIMRRRKRIIMGIQQGIAKEKNRALTGREFSCLMEMPVDEYGAVWTGRIYSQAPEVDGIVYVTGYQKEMGNLVDVVIKKFRGYDLLAECIPYNKSAR